MVLEHASADRLVFAQRRRAPRPLVFGGAIFVVIAALPLLAPGPLTLLRLLGGAALAAIAAGLIAAGRGTKARVELDLAAGIVVSPLLGVKRQLAQAECYALVNGEDPHAPGHRYAVDLVFADGRERILEGPDPARLLDDLRRALAFLPLSVARGWGLPREAAPWIAALPAALERPAEAARRAKPSDVVSDRWPTQRQAGLTVVIGALIIAVLMSVMMLARVRRGLDVSGLSLALSVGTLGAMLLAGAAVGTARSRLRANGVLSIEQSALGLVHTRRELPRKALRQAYPVAPDGTTPLHLLLETSEGPVAIPCVGDAALRMQRALQH